MNKKTYIVNLLDNSIKESPVDFSVLWEASRQCLDVSEDDRQEGLMEFLEQGRTSEFIYGTLVDVLCSIEDQPMFGDFYFVFGQKKPFFVEIELFDFIDKFAFFSAIDNPLFES